MVFGGLGNLIGGQQIAVLIRGIDDLTNPMGKAEKALKKFEKQSKKTKEEAEKTSSSLKNMSLATKLTIAGMAALAFGVGSLISKYVNFLAKQEETKIALNDLKSSFEKLTAPTVKRHSEAMRGYIFLLDSLIEKLNGTKQGTEENRDAMFVFANTLTGPIGSIQNLGFALDKYAFKNREAQIQSEILSNKRMKELEEKSKSTKEALIKLAEKGLEKVKEKASDLKEELDKVKNNLEGLLGVKTEEELILEKEKIPLLKQRVELDKKISEMKAKGFSEDSKQLEAAEEARDILDARIAILDANLEFEELNRKEAELYRDEHDAAQIALRNQITSMGGILKAIIPAVNKANEMANAYERAAKAASKLEKATKTKIEVLKSPATGGEAIVGLRELEATSNGTSGPKFTVAGPGPQDILQNTQAGFPSLLQQTTTPTNNVNVFVEGSIIKQGDFIDSVQKAFQRNLSSLIRY